MRGSICKITLFLITILANPFASLATEYTERFSTSQSNIGMGEQDPEVTWTLELAETGIKSSLEVSFKKTEEISAIDGVQGWEYRVEVDSITVLQNFETDPQKIVEQTIPLETLADGKHTVKLIVRDFEGKLHTQTRECELNSAPRISATFLNDNAEIFDPQITFSFWGEQDGFTGMVEFFLDELPLQTANISGKQNNIPINLSKLIGFQIYNADLTPGTHLLTITAHGINGSSSIHVIPITGILMLPEIQVEYSNDTKLESLEIYFPASSNKIVGSAEVHFNRSTILAVRSEQPTLKISRADLLNALMKNNMEIGASPASIIISARSASQVENWQMVNFQ